MEVKEIVAQRAEKREKIADNIKAKAKSILNEMTAQVVRMMEDAGVRVVRLTDVYDRVSIAIESDSMVKLDGLFLRKGNLYGFAYGVVYDYMEGDESDEFSHLFNNGKCEVLTDAEGARIDSFIEDYNNPLYNLLDDTYCPFETLCELLDTLPVILTSNNL